MIDRKSPFSEEQLSILFEDIDRININILKAKGNKSLTSKEYNKIEVLAYFMGIKIEDMTLFYVEDIGDSPSEELFKSKTHRLGEHISEICHDFIFSDIAETYDTVDDYGEPGYCKHNDDDMIVTVDIFSLPLGIASILEDNGYILESVDDWVVDYSRSKLYRSEPTGYGWEPSCFLMNECEVAGIEDYPEEYIESKINNPETAISSDFNLDKHGWKCIDEVCHETGLYGICEYPEDIYKAVSSEHNGDYDSVVFKICNTGQFSTEWSVWTKRQGE